MSAQGATAPQQAPPAPQGQTASTGIPTETCPMCGSPLAADQAWCLRCGAAARTRLAASPNWRGPMLTVAVVAALSLGVLAAALVKLAGDSGSTPVRTTTITTAQAATTPTASAPAATTPTTPTTTAPSGGTAPKATGKRGAGGLKQRSHTTPSSTPKATSTNGNRTSTSLSGIGGLLEKRLREQRAKAGK